VVIVVVGEDRERVRRHGGEGDARRAEPWGYQSAGSPVRVRQEDLPLVLDRERGVPDPGDRCRLASVFQIGAVVLDHGDPERRLPVIGRLAGELPFQKVAEAV
jgi:hypothetical protein